MEMSLSHDFSGASKFIKLDDFQLNFTYVFMVKIYLLKISLIEI